MKRRQFLKISALGGMGLGLTGFSRGPITHYLTLSFDDGFKKSFYRLAEIHENYGIKACLNVIATGHFPTFKTEPEWMPQHLLGDFEDWNTLKSRGHEIMPHTWDHLNLTKIPFEEAKANIDKCFAYFEKNLEGYDSKKAVYNFAYNASTPELDQYALTKVRSVRTGGWLVLENTMVNKINSSTAPSVLGCWGHGPDFCDDYVEMEVNNFLTSNGGWLILNLHGLDEEGWGPVSSKYLDKLLKRLSKMDQVAVLPTCEVLENAFG